MIKEAVTLAYEFSIFCLFDLSDQGYFHPACSFGPDHYVKPQSNLSGVGT